ncbi:chemotaxis protein CheB [Muricoccus radiodurans]|uniref:chemotaxis protein CheB n=1 Tax=Muricoccus radiodurans TaxID=2231721 RepID=UPI003CEB05F2
MIRVLVVDDSGFMRLALRRIIEAEGDLRVVGEAADGTSALECAARLRPDIVSLDLEMPPPDGLATARRLMDLPDPPAVVMVSHHTRDGSDAALAALAAGAADVLWKGSARGGLDLGHIDRELRSRLRHWAAQRGARPIASPARPGPLAPATVPPPPEAPPEDGACDIVVIGASTGGPDALAALLTSAGPLSVPCAIAQHMPADLGPDFARHLGRRTGLPVVLGERGLHLRTGEVVLLPGATDGHLARSPEGGFTLRLAKGEGPVHPSVDLLLRSAALVAHRALGVVLTGMGRDGSAGAAAMRARGMPVLVQSPESCVVGGMPGAVLSAGHATEVADPAALGLRLRALTRRLAPA